jgi:hypothetical protein
MTLGGWFRDYVYIPLGGNRVRRGRWVLNILAVWMLTGLWHGAAWYFVLWGLLFAVLLLVEKWLPFLNRLPGALRHGYVLLVIVVSFVIFNAENLGQAGEDLMGMFGLLPVPLVTLESVYYLKSFAILLIAVLYFLMRLYIYLLLITFELSIRKVLKNALIFAVLGIKRNVMAILGLILLIAVQILLFFIFQMTPLGIALPLIVMLLYFLGVASFTCTYAAYPVIERYMIDPYVDQLSKNEDEGESE